MKKTFCDRCGIEATQTWQIILRRSPIDQEKYDLCKKCYDNIKWWITEGRKS